MSSLPSRSKSPAVNTGAASVPVHQVRAVKSAAVCTTNRETARRHDVATSVAVDVRADQRHVGGPVVVALPANLARPDAVPDDA